MGEIRRLGIQHGDLVQVERAGDVIPKLTMVVERMTVVSNRIAMPSECPSCGHPIYNYKNGAQWRCTNTLSCKAQIVESIAHYAHKDRMNINKLGPATITKLVNLGYLNSIADIYTLKDKATLLSGIDGIAETTVKELLEAIENSKRTTLPIFISALNIPGIGYTYASKLVEEFKTLAILSAAVKSSICKINGIDEAIGDSVHRFFNTNGNLNVLSRILEAGVEWKTDDFKAVLKSTTWVLTGTFSVPKSDIETLIISYGGKTSKFISNSISHALVGTNPGKKERQARDKGIRIVDEQTFFNLLNS